MTTRSLMSNKILIKKCKNEFVCLLGFFYNYYYRSKTNFFSVLFTKFPTILDLWLRAKKGHFKGHKWPVGHTLDPLTCWFPVRPTTNRLLTKVVIVDKKQ